MGGVFLSSVLIAKQPILTQTQSLYGYELLYRSKTATEEWNGDLATIEVMINAFLNIGIDRLAGSSTVFINFTENLINQELATHFSPEDIVIELLEDTPLTETMKMKIQSLSERGYRLALDDVTPLLFSKWQEADMIKYLTFIKIDFLGTPDNNHRRELARAIKLTDPNIILVAEKVETIDEYEEAKQLGCQLFQGYFFMKPKVMESREIPSYYLAYVKLIEQIDETEIDLSKISNTIKKDLSLSYKLLKLINSPAYRRIERIKSIDQAVVLLGQKEIKKWLYVLALRESLQHSQQPGIDSLVKSSYYRAKMCENLAKQLIPHLTQEAFLVGYFSQLPIILHQTLDQILGNLSLDGCIEATLKGEPSSLRDIFQLVMAYEWVNWEEVDQLTETLNLNKTMVFEAYQKANQWVNDVFRLADADTIS